MAAGVVVSVPAHAGHEGALVVGGRPASAGEYPWMAALYNGSPASGQFCGGSLIKPTFIVTAAHCAVLIVPGVTRAFLGPNDLRSTAGERLIIVAATIHPQYNALTNQYDIAVLRLATPSAQQPINYARAGQQSTYAPGVVATVTGWGLTSEGGNPSDILLEADVPIVSDTTCDQAYGGSIDPATMICAGNLQNGGVDTCQGDSGGPLMVKDALGAPLLAGATSWGNGCARKGFPGVYAEILAGATFIQLIAG